MASLLSGDGANDVSMIHAADIGIGITGQEGLQVLFPSIPIMEFPTVLEEPLPRALQNYHLRVKGLPSYISYFLIPLT